jgi:transposase
MTPAEQEATFIALWTQGLELAAIAQRLGIPKGTVQSRAHRLQQRGLIAPRPKGGAYPRQKALARQEGTPARAPATPPAEAVLPTRDPPAITMVAVPELWELIHRFSGLETRVAALEEGTREATRPRDPPARGYRAVDRATVEGPD